MIVKFPKGFMASLPKKVRNELVLAASKYVYEEEITAHQSNADWFYAGFVQPPTVLTACRALSKVTIKRQGFKFEEADISKEYKAILELEQKAAKAEQLTEAMKTFGQHLNQQK